MLFKTAAESNQATKPLDQKNYLIDDGKWGAISTHTQSVLSLSIGLSVNSFNLELGGSQIENKKTFRSVWNTQTMYIFLIKIGNHFVQS